MLDLKTVKMEFQICFFFFTGPVNSSKFPGTLGLTFLIYKISSVGPPILSKC